MFTQQTQLTVAWLVILMYALTDAFTNPSLLNISIAVIWSIVNLFNAFNKA